MSNSEHGMLYSDAVCAWMRFLLDRRYLYLHMFGNNAEDHQYVPNNLADVVKE
jgi:hypothetical protein